MRYSNRRRNAWKFPGGVSIIGLLGCMLGGAANGAPADTAPAGPGSWTASTDQPPAIELVAPVSAPMEFAASELARYLGRILDAPVAVGAPAAEGQPRIVIEKVADPSPLGNERFTILADGAVLRIRGGGDLGVVFGVYEFLRRYGGCRFSGLGPDGERVPRRARVTAAGLPLTLKPLLWYRDQQFALVGRNAGSVVLESEEACARLCEQHIDWLAKNGFNYVLYSVPILGEGFYEHHLRPAILKRGLNVHCGHHNMYWWFPRSRFADHPDWFPMDASGKRFAVPAYFGLCTSNPEAMQALIDTVKAYLRSHPEVSIVGLIPEDGLGEAASLCHCPGCTAMDVANGFSPDEQYKPWQTFRPRPGTDPLRGNPLVTRRYNLLINQVARAVREEFPDVLVNSRGSVHMPVPDRTLPLEPNVVPYVAMDQDGARPIEEHSLADDNRLLYAALKLWREWHPGKIIIYSYYMGKNNQRSLPYSMDRVILRDWKHLKALGIHGCTCQSRPTCHEVYALNMMAFARAAWYDEVDPDALLDEYLEGMYGAAAGAIRPIYDAFHEAWRAAESNANAAGFSGRAVSPSYNYSIVPQQMAALGDERLDACLEQARTQAADDRERRQVENLYKASRYWKAFAHYLRTERAALDALGKSFHYTARASALKADAELKRAEMEQASRQVPAGWIMEFMGRDTPPMIGQQPQSLTADLGASSAQLRVVLPRQPGAAPIHIQWQKRAGDAFADIPWANFEQYGISPVTAAARGDYRCVLSNSLGTVTSAVATLTVTAPSNKSADASR